MKVKPLDGIITIILTLIIAFSNLLQSTSIRQAQANTVNSICMPQFAQMQSKPQSDADKAFAEAEQLRGFATPESLRKALEKYQEVLQLRLAARDRVGEATTLNRIGLVFLKLNEGHKALDYLKRAIPILREIGDKRGEAENLTNTGGAYYLLVKKEEAINYFQEAATLSQVLNDQQSLAKILKNIAAVYYELGVPYDPIHLQKSLIYAVQSRQLSGFLKDKEGETESLTIIESVLERYRRRIKEFQIRNDKTTSLDILLSRLCYWYSLSNEKYKAVECYKALLPISQGKAFVRGALGLEYTWLGDYQNALENFNQALKDLSIRSHQARQLTNIGYVLYLLGDSKKSLDYLNKALLASQASNNQYLDLYTEALTLTAIGFVYASSLDYEQALNFYLKALPKIRAYEAKKLKIEVYSRPIVFTDIPVEGVIFTAMGLAYNGLGEKRKALDHLDQGLKIIRAAGDRIFESLALANTGLVYYELGDKQNALSYYRQARLVSQIAADRRGEADALYGLAVIEAEQQNFSQARILIESAVNNIETLRAKTPGQELRASFFASVQKYYEFFIYVLMQLHKQNPSAGLEAVALQVSERARARILLESLSESQTDLRQKVDPKLLRREQELQRQLSAKAEAQLRLLTGSGVKQDSANLEKEIDALTSALKDAQTQIYVKSSSYAALTQPQPLSLKEIQKQVLDSDTILLEYQLGDEHSYLWAVSSDSITSYELPKRAEIETTAKRFYELLTKPNQVYRSIEQERGPKVKKVDANNKEIADAASTLSQTLFGIVAEKLEKKRLLIVAEGALQYVPFGALPDPNIDIGGKKQPLLVNHEIVSLPSASTIAVVRKELAARKPAAKTIAILADPVFDKNDERVIAAQDQRANSTSSNAPGIRDLIVKSQGAARESGIIDAQAHIPRLRGTRREAEKIVALIPAQDRLEALDFSASRVMAMSPELGNYRIIHFATHGLANSINPELSGILLSMVNEEGIPQNGFLQAHEIYGLNLPADLVVLSACQTALGKEIKGEGLIGLTRGFMYAGAASVVASLWQVEDDATSELMVKFYNYILKDGLRPAAALRVAQLAMWRDGKWGAPYYWAAFVLQGEWR